MTTMAALIGTLPIALGTGSGSEARRPLGVEIVGGLVFSQVLTLYITRVIYTYMESWRASLNSGNHQRRFFGRSKSKSRSIKRSINSISAKTRS